MALLAFFPLSGSIDDWRKLIAEEMPDLSVRDMDSLGDPNEIEFLLMGRPALKDLPPLPNLKLIMTMLAGVDGFIKNPLLPDVPLVKLEPPGGDPQLTEYAVLHVSRHHRNLHTYQEQQARHEWKPLDPIKKAEDRTVGVLGFGTLSKPIVERLVEFGFDVAAWTRRPRDREIVEIFSGPEGFKPFLARSEIVICLLPLTEETHGILDKDAFAAMPEGGSIISLGRGPSVVDADLIAALESGHLSAATLDVTDPEPLPPESPLWDHSRVTILPHVARRPSMKQRAAQIASHIRRLRAGEPLEQLVDRSAGY